NRTTLSQNRPMYTKSISLANSEPCTAGNIVLRIQSIDLSPSLGALVGQAFLPAAGFPAGDRRVLASPRRRAEARRQAQMPPPQRLASRVFRNASAAR